MSYQKLCPNCLANYIIRPDQQTCSRFCSKEWSTLGPQQRAGRLRQASQPLESFIPDPTPENALEQLDKVDSLASSMPDSMRDFLSPRKEDNPK